MRKLWNFIFGKLFRLRVKQPLQIEDKSTKAIVQEWDVAMDELRDLLIFPEVPVVENLNEIKRVLSRVGERLDGEESERNRRALLIELKAAVLYYFGECEKKLSVAPMRVISLKERRKVIKKVFVAWTQWCEKWRFLNSQVNEQRTTYRIRFERIRKGIANIVDEEVKEKTIQDFTAIVERTDEVRKKYLDWAVSYHQSINGHMEKVEKQLEVNCFFNNGKVEVRFKGDSAIDSYVELLTSFKRKISEYKKELDRIDNFERIQLIAIEIVQIHRNLLSNEMEVREWRQQVFSELDATHEIMNENSGKVNEFFTEVDKRMKVFYDTYESLSNYLENDFKNKLGLLLRNSKLVRDKFGVAVKCLEKGKVDNFLTKVYPAHKKNFYFKLEFPLVGEDEISFNALIESRLVYSPKSSKDVRKIKSIRDEIKDFSLLIYGGKEVDSEYGERCYRGSPYQKILIAGAMIDEDWIGQNLNFMYEVYDWEIFRDSWEGRGFYDDCIKFKELKESDELIPFVIKIGNEVVEKISKKIKFLEENREFLNDFETETSRLARESYELERDFVV